MSDHAIMFTIPRTGPFEEHYGLRAAGFLPVPSEHRPGLFTCWVKHVWEMSDYLLIREVNDVAKQFPDMKFMVVDEYGKTVAMRADGMTP